MIARAGSPSAHALGLAAVAAALLLAARILPVGAPPLSWFGCPLRVATGLPCLGCGCTHAFQYAVRGALAAALLANPLGLVLAVACLAHVLWTALRLGGLPYAPEIELTPRLRWAALVALAGNWIFVAVRGAA